MVYRSYIVKMIDTEAHAPDVDEEPKTDSKSSSPVWDYFTTVVVECNLCHSHVLCPKSETSYMISHLQDIHPDGYWKMLLQTSEKIKPQAKASLDIGEFRSNHENKGTRILRTLQPKKVISYKEVEEESLNSAKNASEEESESEKGEDVNDLGNMTDITYHEGLSLIHI